MENTNKQLEDINLELKKMKNIKNKLNKMNLNLKEIKDDEYDIQRNEDTIATFIKTNYEILLQYNILKMKKDDIKNISNILGDFYNKDVLKKLEYKFLIKTKSYPSYYCIKENNNLKLSKNKAFFESLKDFNNANNKLDLAMLKIIPLRIVSKR